MFNLKIKAKIYQYTGIYLAKREETIAMNLLFYSGYYDKFDEEDKLFQEDTEIGMWQCNNGFYTFMSKYSSPAMLNKIKGNKLRYYFYATLNQVCIFFKQLKYDMGVLWETFLN